VIHGRQSYHYPIPRTTERKLQLMLVKVSRISDYRRQRNDLDYEIYPFAHSRAFAREREIFDCELYLSRMRRGPGAREP
jgi:hypothetical protein